MKLKLRKIGDHTAAILSDDLLSRLEWRAGDILDAEVVDDGLKILRTETVHARAMKIARKGMEKYRDTLEKLAKS